MAVAIFIITTAMMTTTTTTSTTTTTTTTDTSSSDPISRKPDTVYLKYTENSQSLVDLVKFLPTIGRRQSKSLTFFDLTGLSLKRNLFLLLNNVQALTISMHDGGSMWRNSFTLFVTLVAHDITIGWLEREGRPRLNIPLPYASVPETQLYETLIKNVHERGPVVNQPSWHTIP